MQVLVFLLSFVAASPCAGVLIKSSTGGRIVHRYADQEEDKTQIVSFSSCIQLSDLALLEQMVFCKSFCSSDVEKL